MEITISEFKEQYLPKLREKFHTDVQRNIAEHRQEIAEKLEKQIEMFIHFVGTFQKSVPVELGEIQIALLYSSICMGNPQICISAYGQDKLLGEEILNIKYGCDWLFSEWDSYQESIEDTIKQIHAESYIRKSAVKMLMNESISYLTYCLYAVTKYQFAEFEQKGGYGELALTEDFQLTVGGYRDWCRTLYRRRPQVDIFMKEQDMPLTFCTFYGAVYHKKKFSNMDLSHARFYECEFVHCEFENVMLQDSIFENCRIYHCTFHETIFYGATFRKSILKKNQTEQISWDYETDYQHVEDLYKDVDFLECENDGTLFVKENV